MNKVNRKGKSPLQILIENHKLNPSKRASKKEAYLRRKKYEDEKEKEKNEGNQKIIEKIKIDNRHNYEFSFHSNRNLYMIKILKTNAIIIFCEEGKLIHKSCNNIKIDYS